MPKLPMMSKISALFRNKDGNFAMMAAILVPVVFIAGSLAIDTTNALSMKTHLQNAADGAALATASQLSAGTLTEAKAKEYAAKFFQGLASEDGKAYGGFSAVPTVTISSTGTGNKLVWQVQVAAVGSQEATQFARLSGRDTLKVAISGTSKSGQDASTPISMVLVLDRSGSMDWGSIKSEETIYCGYFWKYPCGTQTVYSGTKKIVVLKQAVSNLVNYISEADPTNEYARMGAVAYNDKTRDSDKFNITWTKSGVSNFANSLSAERGTNSADAMEWAYTKVNGPGEINEHFSKNKSKKPKKFIVFMTDGQNDTGNEWNDKAADASTLATCAAAKAQDITIFSVAFTAPDHGKQLLKACASDIDKYYDAQSADDLLKAFSDIGREAAKSVTRLTSSETKCGAVLEARRSLPTVRPLGQCLQISGDRIAVVAGQFRHVLLHIHH